MYKRTKHKFPSLFEKVVLGSLKSLFELGHQVDISMYLMETTTLHQSRDLAGLTPS